MSHRHGFGGGGRFIQHRGIRQFHASQIDNHLLVVEQGFQAPLTDLRLIRRIRGIPAGILQHIALDHFRHQGAVVAHAYHRNIDEVAFAHGAQVIQDRPFADGFSEGQGTARHDAVGHRALDNLFETVETERGEHVRDLLFRRADMAAYEIAAAFEFVEGLVGVHAGPTARRCKPDRRWHPSGYRAGARRRARRVAASHRLAVHD